MDFPVADVNQTARIQIRPGLSIPVKRCLFTLPVNRFFLKNYFRERWEKGGKKGGKRKRKREMWERNLKPGHVPCPENWTRDLSVHWDDAQPTKPHQSRHQWVDFITYLQLWHLQTQVRIIIESLYSFKSWNLSNSHKEDGLLWVNSYICEGDEG